MLGRRGKRTTQEQVAQAFFAFRDVVVWAWGSGVKCKAAFASSPFKPRSVAFSDRGRDVWPNPDGHVIRGRRWLLLPDLLQGRACKVRPGHGIGLQHIQ